MWLFNCGITDKDIKNIHEKLALDDQVFGNGKTGLLTDVDRLKQAAIDQEKLNDAKDKEKGIWYILMGTVIVGLIVNALTSYLIR